MRVLMTSLPVPAHFNTMVPLAWGLQAAGHDVHVASKHQLTEHVTAAGLTAVPLGSGDEHVRLLNQAGTDLVDFYAHVDFTGMREESAAKVLGDNDVLTGTFYALQNNEAFVRELVSHVEHWRPDLIIWEQFTFAGALVGAATNTQHGRLVWSPDLFYRMRQKVNAALADRPSWLRDDALRDWLETAAANLGRDYDDDLLFGQWQIELTPPELRLPSPRRVLPARYVPYNGTSVLEDWVLETPKRPRIVLTTGITARSGHYAHPVEVGEVLRKLAELDIEVIATASEAEQAEIGPLPEWIRLVDFVPLRTLLPSCDGIIHHGGSGTWASALAAGVPQIVISNLWDNVYRGQRLAELGAGFFLRPDEATPEVVRDTLVALMTADGYRAVARRLQDSMQTQPAPAELVPQLAEFATHPRGARR